MGACWVEDELRSADLQDQRLNKRLAKVLVQLAERPTASIPAAAGGRTEMTAAYRFFDNPKTSFENVLQPHVDATRRRVAAQEVALLVHDTTEVDLTRPQAQVSGAGPLSAARWGGFLHVLHAFAPDGTPLGTLFGEAWARDEATFGACAAQTRAERAATPLEQKESHRWVRSWQAAAATAAACPATQCVCVADSEADLYELFVEPLPDNLAWLVRGCHDRALSPENSGPHAAHVWERVAAAPALYRDTIGIRERKPKFAEDERTRRQARASRDAEVTIRAASVTLRPPRRAAEKLAATTVNVVLVREEQPPSGEAPIEWLLWTNLPIDDVEAVRRIVQYYCTRWLIEVLFHVLKSGCRVEARRFEAFDRWTTCLAAYLVVAWRTLFVCRLGRSCPDLSCEAIFEPAEWQATWRVTKRQPPPSQPPPLGEFVRLVAQLGGYVPRKHSPPGPQTLWLGLQRVQDFAHCWELFGPHANPTATLV